MELSIGLIAIIAGVIVAVARWFITQPRAPRDKSSAGQQQNVQIAATELIEARERLKQITLKFIKESGGTSLREIVDHSRLLMPEFYYHETTDLVKKLRSEGLIETRGDLGLSTLLASYNVVGSLQVKLSERGEAYLQQNQQN